MTEKKSRWKKWLIIGAIPLILTLFAYLFRFQLMWLAGQYLIYHDDLEHVETAFVLSGNSIERAEGTAKLYHEGWMDEVVCTGGEREMINRQTGEWWLSSEYVAMVLGWQGLDSSVVKILPEGSSTYEEFQAIKEYCLEKDLKKVMIISSDFHTRRIKRVFKSEFEDHGIETIITGIASNRFDQDKWWETEGGMVFVNNEYIKIIYYSFSY